MCSLQYLVPPLHKCDMGFFSSSSQGDLNGGQIPSSAPEAKRPTSQSRDPKRRAFRINTISMMKSKKDPDMKEQVSLFRLGVRAESLFCKVHGAVWCDRYNGEGFLLVLSPLGSLTHPSMQLFETLCTVRQSAGSRVRITLDNGQYFVLRIPAEFDGR